ncbi:MAG: GNAT family N-acetyltransferase [Firmicutes bacterium]|nr:GNAT family N-acetyltransferase [Bacillota bacterium]
MPRIQYAPTALPGVPYENAFHAVDETGMKCGSAAVVEYINHTVLPDRPLNYYISISAETDRAFDLLMGAVLARSIELRQKRPSLAARIYTPCKPYDTELLRSFQAYGFQNDDAIVRMRRILSDSDRLPNPPVGCAIAPVVLENDEDTGSLLRRVNAYSVTARSPDWLMRLQQEQLFLVFGVWQEGLLLGEMILSAYGAEGRVEMLYTRPEFRRRGVAASLVAYAGELLKQNGIRSLNAEVWRRNLPAMFLFETMRFESVSPTVLYPGINL